VVNLDEISRWERARSRYFLRYNRGPWEQVSETEFIVAEREAGFIPKAGCGPLATAGFGCSGPNGSVDGKIEYVEERSR
jgi:hypothetical protein